MDCKLIPRPNPYSGDISKFPEWQKDFKRYLDMQDERFSKILELIKAERTSIGEQRRRDLGDEAKIGKHQLEMNKKLFNYFKAFASGSFWEVVDACGRRKIYEAYRSCIVG